jgi:hypothetical protein
VSGWKDRVAAGVVAMAEAETLAVKRKADADGIAPCSSVTARS